jgi:integrase
MSGGQPETLKQALERVYRDEWSKMRDGGSCLYSQATLAIMDIDYGCARPHTVLNVHQDRIKECTAAWYARGLAPATITKRLNCLGKLGVNVEGLRPKKDRKLQWWLRPADRDRLCAYLRGKVVRTAASADDPWAVHEEFRSEDPRYDDLADLIEWTTYTGLRIEESLRLRWSDIGCCPERGTFKGGSVTVPGLKTAAAQATIPLAEPASLVLANRWNGPPSSPKEGDRVFDPLDYNWIAEKWATVCRPFLGVTDPTCTLKALRRSAARYLHVERGMPLDVVRQYLRHEDVETTMGYLRLTGGYEAEEMRRWL